MASEATLARNYQGTLGRVADHTQRLLLVLFDRVEDYSNGDQFHDNAVPIVTAAAQASVDTTAAYLEANGYPPLEPSELVVADAAARCYDPFDRLAANLAKGIQYTEAILGARSQAAALGDDAVHRTARDAMAQMASGGVWMRRLTSSCCQWCMKLSSVRFDGPGEATFGHAHCRCIAVPADLSAHNAKVRGAEGFDAKAEELFDKRDARKSLKDQARNAQRRSDQAAADALVEPDPKRRDRLETRAQEWETRAEAANERLRILETGTHRLAA